MKTIEVSLPVKQAIKRLTNQGITIRDIAKTTCQNQEFRTFLKSKNSHTVDLGNTKWPGRSRTITAVDDRRILSL